MKVALVMSLAGMLNQQTWNAAAEPDMFKKLVEAMLITTHANDREIMRDIRQRIAYVSRLGIGLEGCASRIHSGVHDPAIIQWLTLDKGVGELVIATPVDFGLWSDQRIYISNNVNVWKSKKWDRLIEIVLAAGVLPRGIVVDNQQCDKNKIAVSDIVFEAAKNEQYYVGSEHYDIVWERVNARSQQQSPARVLPTPRWGRRPPWSDIDTARPYKIELFPLAVFSNTIGDAYTDVIAKMMWERVRSFGDSSLFLAIEPVIEQRMQPAMTIDTRLSLLGNPGNETVSMLIKHHEDEKRLRQTVITGEVGLGGAKVTAFSSNASFRTHVYAEIVVPKSVISWIEAVLQEGYGWEHIGNIANTEAAGECG